jgi:serine protease Do
MQLKQPWIFVVVGLLVLATLGCGTCSFTAPRSGSSGPADQSSTVSPASEVVSITPAPVTPTVVPATPTLVPPAAAGTDNAGELLLINVYARVSPSVVYINLNQTIDMSGLQIPEGHEGLLQRTQGSGFVYDSAGYIVTNYHVVAGGSDIEVVLTNGDAYPAEIVGGDEASDLAVLWVEAPADQLPAVELGDSDQLQVGQRAIAIGNPFGFQHTMTTGIVSSIGRVIAQDTGFAMPQMIQTDAAINPGNSGGPLLDSTGRVIGVNTMIFTRSGSSSGVGFAIPVNRVKQVVPALIENGVFEHAWLGVRGTSLTRRLAEALEMPQQRGALITEVIAGGPADQAGLRGPEGRINVEGMAGSVPVGGDIITAIGDCRVGTFDDLVTCIASLNVGKEVTVTLIRDGQEQILPIVLERRGVVDD